MVIIYFFLAILLIFVLFEVVYFLRKKKGKFSPRLQGEIAHHLEKIANLSPREQILEYDKLLDLCLKYKGLSGSLGEKMKQYGKLFHDTDAIWRAHKLRNRIAHELDFVPSKNEFQASAQAFAREIKAFLQ